MSIFKSSPCDNLKTYVRSRQHLFKSFSRLSIPLSMKTKSVNGPYQFSRSVVYDSLWSHGLHHARLPYPSPTPGICSDLCPMSRWCHPTISSSVVPFSSCLQSFPLSGSFPMSQFFTSGGQNIGTPALASGLPMNIQDWFPSGWTGWISLQSKGLSGVSSSTTVFDLLLESPWHFNTLSSFLGW